MIRRAASMGGMAAARAASIWPAGTLRIAPAKYFGLIGGCVEREGEERAEERIAEQPPQPGRGQRWLKLSGAVIKEEKLGEQRRAAKQVGVSEERAADGLRGKDAAQRGGHRDHQRKGNRAERKLKRHGEPFQHARAEALEQVPIDHAGPFQPRPAIFSARAMASVESAVISR